MHNTLRIASGHGVVMACGVCGVEAASEGDETENQSGRAGGSERTWPQP